MAVDMGEPDRKLVKRRSFSYGLRKTQGYGSTAGETYQGRAMKRCVQGTSMTDGSPLNAPGDMNLKAKAQRSKRRVRDVAAAAGAVPSTKHAVPAVAGKRQGNHRNTLAMLQHNDDPAVGEAGGDGREGVLSRPVAAQQVRVVRDKAHPVLGLTIDEDLVVVDVMKGTAAQTAGFEVGRRLQSIDGQKIHSQDHAIAALRAAGDEINVGLVPVHAQAVLAHKGVPAGVQTSYQPQLRRSKKAVGPSGATDTLNQSPRAARGSSSAAARRSLSAGAGQHSLGHPGMGVISPPWGDDNNIPALSPIPAALAGKEAGEGDPYKPNLYVPPRFARSGTGIPLGTSNKTTLELAAEGQSRQVEDLRRTTDAIQIGGVMRGVSARGRLKAAREGVHTEVSHSASEGAAPQPTRRLRGASPRAAAATGVPVGQGSAWENIFGSQRRAKRAGSFGRADTNILTLASQPPAATGSSASRSHSAPGGRRSVHPPIDNGDIIKAPPSADARPSGGRRRVFSGFDAPAPARRSFTPTLRHPVQHPAPSDIHHQQTYRGDCAEFVAEKKGRTPAPKNDHSISLTEPPPRTIYTSVRAGSVPAGSTRRGKGLGCAAPPQPGGGYTPWGQRY